MGRPYSLDLRERVVAAMCSGMSSYEAGELYEVGATTACRWYKRNQETGSPAALPMGGRKPFALAEHRDWLLGRISEEPDVTIFSLWDELRGKGIEVSYFAVWHIMNRAGLSFKKKSCMQVSRIGRMLHIGADNGKNSKDE